MDGFTLTMRAIGIAAAGTVLSWLTTFGIVFITQVAQHQAAHVGNHHGGPGWLAIPVLLTACSAGAGIVSGAWS